MKIPVTLLGLFVIQIVYGSLFGLKAPTEKSQRGQVCYDNIGCFSNESPWWSVNRPLSLLPATPQQIGTRFYLYTRNDRKEHEIQWNKEYMLNDSDFAAQRQTKIIIHGFTHYYTVQWAQDMKDALLDDGDFNVMIVDWRNGAKLPYTQCTANARVVGAQVAQLIEWLDNQRDVKPDSFHIIGHSMGAHIAGYAGKRLNGLGRISGLDPAMPYFENMPEAVRLDRGDAVFVDVIHSDAKGYLSLGLGLQAPVGHVDFYPNGGTSQPGCAGSTLGQIFTTVTGLIGSLNLISSVTDNFACSHLRAIHLYTESIKQKSGCRFVAYPCPSWKEYQKGNCYACGSNGERCSAMGYEADKYKGALGSLYLTTETEKDFCANEWSISFRTKPGTGAVKAKVWVRIHGEDDLTNPETELTPDAVTIPDDGSTFVLRARNKANIGNVKAISVRYIDQKMLTFWKPAPWYLSYIKVDWNEPASKSVKICAHGLSIESKQTVTFDDLSGNC